MSPRSADFAVDWSWHTSEPVLRGPGPAALLFYPDGSVRFQHLCRDGSGDERVCAPLLSGHTVDAATLTVSPSIDCPGCGIHGFIQGRIWRAAGPVRAEGTES